MNCSYFGLRLLREFVMANFLIAKQHWLPAFRPRNGLGSRLLTPMKKGALSPIAQELTPLMTNSPLLHLIWRDRPKHYNPLLLVMTPCWLLHFLPLCCHNQSKLSKCPFPHHPGASWSPRRDQDGSRWRGVTIFGEGLKAPPHLAWWVHLKFGCFTASIPTNSLVRR